MEGFFTQLEDTSEPTFEATHLATSNWSDGGSIRGMAISGLMAGAAEEMLGADTRDFLPVRWTLDLARAVPRCRVTARAATVRTSRRLRLVDVELQNEGNVYAWARALFLRLDERAQEIDAWEPQYEFTPPPIDLEPEGADSRLYWSESVGWTATAEAHHGAQRKQIWQPAIPIVTGRPPSPFQAVAAAADLASVATHWGSRGLAHINADVSVSLTRLPAPGSIGVVALDRTHRGNLAAGTALLYDRNGQLGTSTTSALTQGDQIVDPGDRDHK